MWALPCFAPCELLPPHCPIALPSSAPARQAALLGKTGCPSPGQQGGDGRRPRLLVHPPTGDEVFGVGLRVVEDDEDGGLPRVVHRAVVPLEGGISFPQGWRSHAGVARCVVPDQRPGHKDVFVAIGTARRVLITRRETRRDRKVDAVAVVRGWKCGRGQESFSQRPAQSKVRGGKYAKASRQTRIW